MSFTDRTEAGRTLAARIKDKGYESPVVLALPRGGVPVAFEIARTLKAPLDLVLVRKIGVPYQPELALAAVVNGADPQVVVNEEVSTVTGLGEDYLDAEVEKELKEIERRRKLYLKDRDQVPITDRTAIVVDDGIATGASMRAALRALRRKKPKKLVLAVPTAPAETITALESETDEIVCLETPSPFIAIGLHYMDFHQMSDEEVRSLVVRADEFLVEEKTKEPEAQQPKVHESGMSKPEHPSEVHDQKRTGHPQDVPRDGELIEAVRLALRKEPRLGDDFHPARLEMAEDGTLILEAVVEHVAQKKIALERAASVSGVTGIVDRVRVRPASHMGDDEIRVHIRNALLEDPSFAGVALIEKDFGHTDVIREPGPDARGRILLEARDGVVILTGEVPGLASKRLAAVIAWWVPGSRDVINGLAVQPPEEDGPDQIEEAVRVALEKDPFVNAGQIRVGVRHRTVRLTGLVPSNSEREMAEADAWYVFGVDDVINEIEVRA